MEQRLVFLTITHACSFHRGLGAKAPAPVVRRRPFLKETFVQASPGARMRQRQLQRPSARAETQHDGAARRNGRSQNGRRYEQSGKQHEPLGERFAPACSAQRSVEPRCWRALEIVEGAHLATNGASPAYLMGRSARRSRGAN